MPKTTFDIDFPYPEHVYVLKFSSYHVILFKNYPVTTFESASKILNRKTQLRRLNRSYKVKFCNRKKMKDCYNKQIAESTLLILAFKPKCKQMLFVLWFPISEHVLTLHIALFLCCQCHKIYDLQK